MTTSTKDTAIMVEKYDLENLLSPLKDSGLVLLPTDTVWSVACNAGDPVALHRLKRLKGRHQPFELELLVSSLDMLKRYTTHLHPRLETLLCYHDRPLTIVIDQIRALPAFIAEPAGAIAVRLVRDTFCATLINSLDKPLLSTSANSAGDPVPANFGAIRSDVIERVDYVAHYRRQDRTNGELAVMVQLAEDDELIFLRD